MKEQIKKLKENLRNRYFESSEENKEENDIYMPPTTNKEIENVSLLAIKEESKVLAVSKPSIISNTTEITGNINTQADLYINGNIFGDIITTGNLEITDGIIIGNIKAANIIIKSSKIQGSITCQLSIESHIDSEIIGTIKSQKALLDCYCEGNIYVHEVLHLLPNTNVKGDIQAKKLKIDEGALIEGKIKIDDK